MKNALTLVSLLVVACSGEPFGTPLFVELDGDIVDVHQPELDAGDAAELEAGPDVLELDASDAAELEAGPDVLELDASDASDAPNIPDAKPDTKPDAGELDCCGPVSCSSPSVHECVCDFDINCCATWDSLCGTLVESKGCGVCS